MTTDILALADKLRRGEARTAPGNNATPAGVTQEDAAPAGRSMTVSGPRVAGMRAGEDGLRLAGHLSEFAWQAAPDDPEVRAARHHVFTIRAERATSTMSSGVDRWAASESLGDPFPPSDLES
jgi:hypothetical protein